MYWFLLFWRFSNYAAVFFVFLLASIFCLIIYAPKEYLKISILFLYSKIIFINISNYYIFDENKKIEKKIIALLGDDSVVLIFCCAFIFVIFSNFLYLNITSSDKTNIDFLFNSFLVFLVGADISILVRVVLSNREVSGRD